MKRKLTPQHFYLYNNWAEDKRTAYEIAKDRKPFWVNDLSTGDQYINEDLSLIRFKCFLLTLGTPIIHTIRALAQILLRLAELISCYDFWKSNDEVNADIKDKKEAPGYQLSKRCLQAGNRLFDVFFAPLAVVLLEFAAIYGLIMPRDGRKLFASLERFTYGDYVLAPCFQPYPDHHLFGGDIEALNTF